ncbi:MAG: hypothetical protein IID34_09110 [Planctomycetes bacterium]|nr:hypothetical protein [Planctomycetota bacterium]
MNATKNIKRFRSCVILSMAMSCGLPTISQGGEICPTNSSGPEICVSFDGDTPELDFDFTVDYVTDPANPSVVLKTGNLTWNVRSRVGPPPLDIPANIGTISIDPTAVGDFEVSILNGTGAGAANVGTINLTDAGGYSSIEGGSISGNLTGGLTLVHDIGFNGGELTLTIDGDVSGPMTIPVLKDLTIGGDLTANLDVTYKVDGPGLVVLDNVTSGVVIHIADIASGDLQFTTATDASEVFAGNLTLDNGIPFGTEVFIPAFTTFDAVIDLNGSDLAGTLWSGYVSAANITGGALTGTLKFGICAAPLLQDCCNFPSGFPVTAEFASVSSTGLILYDKCGSLSNTLSIAGDMDGEITVTGYVHPNAQLAIGGIVRGDITIKKDVQGGGVISLLGRMEGGSLTVHGDAAYYPPDGASQIIIADMVSDPGGNPSMVDLQKNLAGDLELYSGIKANQQVRVGGQLTSTGSILLNNNDVSGSLEIARGGAGTINSGGAVTGTVILADGPLKTYSGDADFASVSGAGVIKTLNGAHFIGQLDFTSSCSGDIEIAGNCGGDVAIGGSFKGDMDIQGDLSGSLTVDDALDGVGRILVSGESSGAIKVGKKTGLLTLIHAAGGLATGATIEINTSRGPFNAEGVIYVGAGAACVLNPPNVTFDGCIRIYDHLPGMNFGDLIGSISISGCHSTTADLNICIDGAGHGNVNICQNGCPNQVGWSCPIPACP